MVLKISIVAAVISALLGSFLVVRTSDEAAVNGTKSVMIVWDLGAELSREETHDLIASAAEAADISLYYSHDSVVDGRTRRDLRVIHLGRDESLPRPGMSFESFSRSIDTRFVTPASTSAALTPGGTYVTGADEPFWALRRFYAPAA